MTDRILIYGRSSCPFCIHAQDFCIANSLEFKFLDYIHDEEFLEECKEFYDHPTVPIVLSNDLDSGLVKKIGGYTDLLDRPSE